MSQWGPRTGKFQPDWQVLEICDRWGLLLGVTSDGRYQERSRSPEQTSEIFYWYLDGRLVLSFLEGGPVLVNRLGGS
ncbi:MAG: hypothetical protein SVX43_01705 [Cyanobacteriota bacterium]|nr:hypothetical protein [Cyanobacteriota bacterium]